MLTTIFGAAMAIAGQCRAADNGIFAIDPALVQSLPDVPKGLIRAHPYIAHFRKGELNLYFVSASHENRVESETFRVIRRAFKRFPINRVIVEGSPYVAGDASWSEVKRIERELPSGVLEWGETDYAILLAARKNVRAIGGEPTQKQLLQATLDSGFKIQDFLGQGFVKMIPAYQAQGRIGKGSLEKLFSETTEWRRRESGLPDSDPFGYQIFLRWYKERLGTEFDPAKIEYNLLGSDPRGNYLQRIGEAHDRIRNQFLADVISAELKKHKHVLVVYGNGHHAVLRRALEAALGRPVYEGP